MNTRGFVITAGALLTSGCSLFPPQPTATYTCNGTSGCCCSAPIEHYNPAAGRWPVACASGFQCVAMQPGGVIHPDPGIGRLDVNVCWPMSAPLTSIPQLASTQPSYCRTDINP